VTNKVLKFSENVLIFLGKSLDVFEKRLEVFRKRPEVLRNSFKRKIALPKEYFCSKNGNNIDRVLKII